jgi:hypothetical protein
VEIRGGFASAHILTHRFLLHADRETLVRRAEQDPASNRRWRFEHPGGVLDALSWLHEEAEILGTAEVAVADVARLIAAKVAA